MGKNYIDGSGTKSPAHLLKDNCQALDGTKIVFGFTDDDRSVTITNADGGEVTKADSVRLLAMFAHTVAHLLPQVNELVIASAAIAKTAMEMEQHLAGPQKPTILVPTGGFHG